MRREGRPRSALAFDKLHFMKCLLVVATVRLGLTLVGYQRVRRLLPSSARPPTGERELRRIVKAVSAASRLVPRATCLTQAVSAQFLLARAGHPSRIQIGVRHDGSGKLAAHAWVISGERILMGGTEAELQPYQHLTELLPRSQ